VRQVRTAALSRHAAPPFVMLAGLELMTLRQLSHLARALFIELLALADHVTGQGSTSWAVLCALLDFDRTPKAHAVAGATVKRLRTAMEELRAAGLVRVDRIKNEKAQGLFFRVGTRQGLSAPDAMRGRVRGRVEKPEKPATTRGSRRRGTDEGQGEGQGVQEPNTYPLPPSLSTSTRPPPAIGALLQKLKPARG